MQQSQALRQLAALKAYADKTSMRLAAEGWDEDWKVIVAILMSAQTRDEVTIQIAERLFSQFKTIEALARAPVEVIATTISSINYYKTKAKHIKACAERIAHEGITYDIDWLTTLPGVGRKTANVFLVEVENTPAIGVDTHVARISHKLGWTQSTNPIVVEHDLMKLFPKAYWNSINSTLVRFGKGHGTSRKREDEILNEIQKV